MPNYITALNELIVDETSRLPRVVLYGENLNTGSRISGLTKNLRVADGGRIINVGNCEATHCGVGFGLMLNGVTAVLFVKQLDFMLLAMDHFVSTYNSIRSVPPSRPLGSFTIITIVCDHGYQGPQSSFNALGDICSLARVPGYALTNRGDAAHVLRTQLATPGFRFVALSQRLFPTEVLTLPVVYAAPDSSVFQYKSGCEVTIVCLNFSLPYGHTLAQRLEARGLSSSLFSANYVHPMDWGPILTSAVRTRRVLVLDDSKSVHSAGHALLEAVSRSAPDARRMFVGRERDIPFGVSPDEYDIDYDALARDIAAGK